MPRLEVTRALLFEALDELPGSLRTGTLNYAVCPACGFAGWLWPGFLCVDLRRRRALFVFNQLDSIGLTDTALAEALAHCTARMPPGSPAIEDSELCYLSHYRELLPTLLLENRDFAERAALDRDYYRRRRLATAEHAAQFIDDTLALGLFSRFADERTSQFLAACIDEIERRLACSDSGERGALDWLRGALAPLLTEALERAPVADDEAPLPAEAYPDSRQMSGHLDDDLGNFVAREANAYTARVAQEAEGASAILSELATRLDSVVIISPPPKGDSDALRQARLDELAEPIARVQALCPDGFVGAQGHPLMHVHELVARAAGGARDLQKALADIVARDPRARDAALGEETIALFVEIATRFGDIEAMILAWCVAADRLEAMGAESAQAAALCKAIETLHGRGRGRPINGHVLEFIAISWRAMAARLARFGAIDLTALCLGQAARNFAWLGRTEQELECRMDLLQIAPRLAPGRIETVAAEALMARIDAAGLKDAWEKRCRLGMMVGDALLRQAIAMPLVGTYFAQRLKEADADDTSSPASMRLHNPSRDRPAKGQIMVMCAEEDPWAISSLEIIDVPWLEQYEAVIAAALEHGPSEVAAAFMLQVASTGLNLGIPEIARYQMARLERTMAQGWGIEFASLALSFAAMIGRELRLTGIDPRTHAPFRKAVERALALAGTERERTSDPLHVPETSIAQALGELLELLGRRDAAIHWHLEASRRAAEALPMAWNPNQRHQHEADIVRGYWRAARAAAKDALDQPSPEARARALGLAEAARRYAVRLKRIDQPDEPDSAEQAVLTTLPAPAVHYSLLQETELNDGFWMIALQDGDGQVPELVVQDMEAVHRAVSAVSSLFRETREGASSAMLADFAESERDRLPAYHAVLETLADLLLPEAVTRHFSGFERLTVIPEAYLWDVPWAALRVATESGERAYLHGIRGMHGPLRLCASPNLEIAGRPPPGGGHGSPSISRMHAAPIGWRHDLAPVFGLGQAIDNAIAALGGRCGPVAEVDADTQGFRALLERGRLAIFSGHGEATDRGDLELIVQDGRVGAEEIHALWPGAAVPAAEAVLLCACAGVRSFYAAGISRRELGGAHVELVRQGVHFVLGSTQPLSVVAAAAMAESFLRAAASGGELDTAASVAISTMADDAMLFSPLFWGGIIGFGRGDFTLVPEK